MASVSNSSHSPDKSVPPDHAVSVELGAIDTSTRWPVLFFFLSGLVWLLVGTGFALISSFKLHTPEFLADYEWLSFGRARAAHLNTVIYGWAANVGFAVIFWLMARLSCTCLRQRGLLIIAGAFWNIGVTLGVGGILAGDSTSIEWLEMPAYVTPLLLVAYALVGVWAVLNFSFRRKEQVFVSQWYLFAALFWFPWLYSVAQVMLHFQPVQGTVQALVNWWFAENLQGLWFTPIGLAAVYYFVPKVLGKPIHSYYLAVLGFWSLALFGTWTGIAHLIGGPVPAWVISTSIAASFMMIIPVVVTSVNFHLTLAGSYRALRESPTLRFVVFGAVNFALAGLTGSIVASRSINEITQFTHFNVGHVHQGMHGFYTMVMFGALYYILPRVLLKEWPSASLIRTHFWCAAIGITIAWIDLEVGGVLQGLQLNNADTAFIDVVHNTVPYLLVRSLAGIVMTLGHVAFAVNVGWMLCTKRVEAETAATLLSKPGAAR